MIINEKRLNLLQTFNAMRIFLSLYYQKTHAEDIGMLLGGLRLFKDKDDWAENPETWDAPAWQDWMDGVHKTLQDLQIDQDPKKVLYDEKIAFLCMKNYLELFYNNFPFEDIEQVLKFLKVLHQNKHDVMWQQWLQAMSYSKKGTYLLDAPLVASE